MATLTAKRKAEIADELEVASSWVGGPRAVKLRALAEELRGTDPDEAPQVAAQKLADEAADTAKEQTAPEAEGDKPKARGK